jgi:hypothetical protein
MRFRISRRYLTAAAAVAIAVVIAVHVYVGDVHLVITGVGFATFLLAVAALATAWVKVREYIDDIQARTLELEEKMNGGFAEEARLHMQESELLTGVLHRMDRFERERDDCLEKYDSVLREVNRRFAENGLGSNGERGNVDVSGSGTTPDLP